MARLGVTFQDVELAARALQDLQLEPTVDRVREHLGTGSKSTIGPLLKKWKAGQRAVEDASGLPEVLVEAVRTLHLQLQSNAQEQIEQITVKLEETDRARQQESEAIKQELLQSKKHAEELAQLLSESQSQLANTQQQLEHTRLELVKSTAQRDESLAKCQDLKTALQESNQERRDIRSHFEHYQASIAEEREREREQQMQSLQALDIQIQGLRGEISEQRMQNEALQGECESQKQKQETLQRENQYLQIQNEKAQLEGQHFKSLSESLSEKLQTIETENGDAQRGLQDSKHQVVELTMKLSQLDSNLVSTKQQLDESLKTMQLLTAKNHSLQEEKSILEGRYQQLCAQSNNVMI